MSVKMDDDFLELLEQEFVIFTKDIMLLIQLNDRQTQFLPATMNITNYNIIISLPSQSEIKKIPISNISKFAQSIINECTVFDIFTSQEEVTKIFISDTKPRSAVASILSQLCAANEQGQMICDTFSRELRLQILSYDSLDYYFHHYDEIPRIELSDLSDKQNDDYCKKKQRSETQIKETILLSLNPFNFFSDFVETAPDIFFALFILFIVLCTFIFNFITFGSFVCIVLLLMIAQTASHRIRHPSSHIQIEMNSEDENDKNYEKNPLKSFVLSVQRFQRIAERRVFWKSRDETAEVASFLMLVLLLFLIFDPAFLLVLSLVGLAFFERWDPFGYGSLSTFLSHLILW
ncbi:hypothetical protein TRFO_42575 [Tritrichomonas foetus]|uniref:Uncharacterized protein n=1 Tax=Tritrichomonas foetus TaxID=1144522 RepID=A0A1J4KW23_9EUKA|nr:hypothetical protein TRFO_42575 [Tritrichomonas foetus]|eukprot:OHT15338.1 hypothetical protein TRFO_42575 [Tritrichomonas foetus]